MVTMIQQPRHIVAGLGAFSTLVDDPLTALSLEQPPTRRAVAVVTGGRSFRASRWYAELTAAFERHGVDWFAVTVGGEPSPETIDAAVADLRRWCPVGGAAASEYPACTVLAIGGGSVIDAAKAIAAVACEAVPCAALLEGVGTQKPSGRTLPVVAVPTTAGTGSEATKNAVISRVATDGFKKSLRHDNFVVDSVILDGRLADSCPFAVTAACGADALTQLIEPYVSLRANTFTDELARAGIRKIGTTLVPLLQRLKAAETGPATDSGRGVFAGPAATDSQAVQWRQEMAWAAFWSGVCLANAGLGLVHGFASPIGAYRPIPHGVVCACLLGPVIEHGIAAIDRNRPQFARTAHRYAEVGFLLAGESVAYDPVAETPSVAETSSVADGIGLLRSYLRTLNDVAGFGSLGDYGFQAADLELVAARTVAKDHPIPTSVEERLSMLRRAL